MSKIFSKTFIKDVVVVFKRKMTCKWGLKLMKLKYFFKYFT